MSRFLLLLFVSSCCRWTRGIDVADRDRATMFSDGSGAECLEVVVYGTADEQMRFKSALTGMCDALRDPGLESFLSEHVELFVKPDREVLKRNGVKRYLAPWRLGRPTFYLVPMKKSSPGISEICLSDGVRAVGVDRGQRLTGPQDTASTALLLNTITHETIHLYPEDGKGCLDQFNDSDGPAKQCHELSYVAGNAAACAFLSHQPNWTGWKQCMADQADLTPGHQGRGPRDDFGCSIPR